MTEAVSGDPVFKQQSWLQTKYYEPLSWRRRPSLGCTRRYAPKLPITAASSQDKQMKQGSKQGPRPEIPPSLHSCLTVKPIYSRTLDEKRKPVCVSASSPRGDFSSGWDERQFRQQLNSSITLGCPRLSSQSVSNCLRGMTPPSRDPLIY